MKKKAVIFDFDGLLVDSEKACWNIYQNMAKRGGREIDSDTYAKTFSGKTAKANVRQLVDDYQIGMDFAQAWNWMTELEKEELQNIPLKKGAEELICWLQKNHFKIALATSSVPDRALRILKRFGLENAFDAAVYGPDVEHGKPAPDIFLKAAEKLGIDPEDCVVFEDSGSGILAGVHAGMDVMYVPDWLPAPEEKARLAACTLSSLDEAIGKLSIE